MCFGLSRMRDVGERDALLDMFAAKQKRVLANVAKRVGHGQKRH